MSGQKLVTLGSLTKGSENCPSTIWISPHRESSGDDSSVKRIIRFEDHLTSIFSGDCTEMVTKERNLETGQILALKHCNKYVRGKLSKVVDTDVVEILLVDWGKIVTVERNCLFQIPTSIKQPKTMLAYQLIVKENRLNDHELVNLKEIVNHVKVGWLSDVSQSPCGLYLNGRLSVKINREMEVFVDTVRRKEIVGDLVSLLTLLDIWKKRCVIQEPVRQSIKSKLQEIRNNSASLRSPSITESNDSFIKMDGGRPLINLNSNQKEQPTDNKSLLPTQGHQLGEQALHGVEDLKSLTLKQKLDLAKVKFGDKSNLSPTSSAKDPVNISEISEKLDDRKIQVSSNHQKSISNQNDIDASYQNNMKTVAPDITHDEVNVSASSQSSGASSSLKSLRDTVPARLELDRGGHTKFEERWGAGDTLGKLVVHKPVGGRNIKHCDSAMQMEWIGSLASCLRQRHISHSSLVQSMMWPTVSRLQSVVGIASPTHGKTFGWLLPLLNSLADRAQYSSLPSGHSPLAIVLCPGLACASIVQCMLQDVSSEAKLGVRTVLACAGARNNEPSDFINGVDVLVTTPPRFLKLLEDKFIGFERCCHLVVEAGDKTVTSWHKQLATIMKSWRRKRFKIQAGLPDQLIVVSEKWVPAVEEFTKLFILDSCSPVLIFANMMEAVVYGKVKIDSAFLMDASEKINYLKNFIVSRDVSKRMVICCRDIDTIKVLETVIREVGERPVLIHSRLDISDLKSVFDQWNNKPSNILVVSDDAMPSLNVPGADRGTILLHWDLPSESKSCFSSRLAFIKSGIKSLFNTCPPQQVSVLLMLSPNDAASLNTIIPWLKRTGSVITDGLELFHQATRLSRAKQSLTAGSPLCTTLATRGSCVDSCTARHFIHVDVDSPPETEKVEGIVMFSVLFVETPVVYWVRLQNMETASNYQRLVMSMARYFANPVNRKPLDVLERGKLVAAAGTDGVFKRVRLENTVYKVKGSVHYLESVEVFMVDSGVKETVQLTDLSELPDHLGADHYPTIAKRVIVGGLMAMDSDSDWGVQSTMYVSSAMESQGNAEVVCRGRVLLHMSDTIWVDRCQVLIRQPTLGKFVCSFETVSWLVKEGFASTCVDQMKHLFAMADKAGILRASPCEVSLESSIDEEGPACPIRTAHLPKDEVVTVYMSECFSPYLFYVHRVAFIESLNRLEKDITDWIEKECLFISNYKPNVGEVIAVKQEEDSFYNRAKVLEVLGTKQVSDDKSELRLHDMYKVFLVDVGITLEVNCNEIAECRVDFINRLPFQAIPCRLTDICPLSAQWEKEVGDRLFNMTRDNDTDEPLVLECLVDDKIDDLYCVKLKLKHGGEIAQELVEHSYAQWIDTSAESGFNSDENELVTEIADKEEDWEMSNGMLDDVINMKELYAATKEGCEQYLEENLGDIPSKSKPISVPSTTTSVTCPVRLDSSHKCPVDLPSASILSGHTKCNISVPHIEWSQDHSTIFLKVSVNSVRDINPGQVHIGLKEQELQVQVLDIDTSSVNDEVYTVFQTPSLRLHGKVKPSETKVTLNPRGMNISISKHMKLFWMQLCKERFGWIKKDPNVGLKSDDSDSESVVTSRPHKGFLSSYLAKSDTTPSGIHGKRYHPITGAEIMPEALWYSSQSEEENDELGFIHENVLEFNPDIL